MGPIAVAAYSYMSLVPIIQPPVMKLLTTEKERKIKMEQLRSVSNPVPDCYHHRCLHDPSIYRSAGRYADAW